MGCATEVIVLDDVRASHQRQALRQQLHERFDRWLVVAIGVSTGGPNALAELFPNLPEDFPVPIVIVTCRPCSPSSRQRDSRQSQSSRLQKVQKAPGSNLAPRG